MMKEEPARKNLWVALLAALILTSPFAVATGDSDDDDEFIPNVLTVDATTGEGTEWEFNNAASTDIRVLNVASATDGYTLVDPLSRPVFIDQTSTYHGVVEFWYQILLPGNYTVVKDHGTDDETFVTEFEVTQSIIEQTMQPQAQPNSLEGPGDDTGDAVKINDPTLDGGGDTRDGCGAPYRFIGDRIQWTPLIINHAPYGGSSVASSGWSSAKSIMVMPLSWSSSQTTNHQVTINVGGETTGQFQLAKWGKYEKLTCEGSGTGKFTAQVIDWEPFGTEDYKEFDLWGSSKTTDSDDKEQVYGAKGGTTYVSTRFDNRYVSADQTQSTTTSGSEITKKVTTKTFIEVGGSVSFSSGYVSMDALKMRAVQWSGTYYEYTFPNDGHCYYMDELGGGKNGALAFHRGSYGSC